LEKRLELDKETSIVMKKNTATLAPDTYYHIFNRGINKEILFKEKRNYTYFLNKYLKFISPIAKTYAFCLLKNHFHFLICTRSEETLKKFIPEEKDYSSEQIISLQFSHLFNSYAQAINKRFSRTGGLFETPFRRIEINDENYLIKVIAYIHLNPYKHGFTKEYIKYIYSSYHLLLQGKSKILETDIVMNLFGGNLAFINFHKSFSETINFEPTISFDFNDYFLFGF
jgi:REP element-mobilizing transposase RayT